MPKKLETWQIWHALKRSLGESFLMAVMGKKNARTIRLYSQDPRTSEDRCKDPLEALHIIFSEADEIGRGDLAKKAIDYLLSALSEHPYDLPAINSLLPTQDAENLEDYRTLNAFHEAMNNGADADLAETLLNESIEAQRRSFAKYLRG